MSVERMEFKKIIESVLGSGTVKFDATTNESNCVIGSFKHNDFFEFKECIRERIARLGNRLEDNREFISKALNSLASSKNWEGAMAELSALDCLSENLINDSCPISFDVTMPANDTVASDFGMTNIDHDFVLNHKIKVDVKIFADTITDILSGIYYEVRNRLQLRQISINPSYDSDLESIQFQNNRTELLNELLSKIDLGKKQQNIESSVVNGLAYDVLIGAGVTIGTQPMSPLAEGENRHKLFFTHAKKYTKSNPCLLIFVSHPWWKKSYGFEDSKLAIYKTMAEKFFLGYKDLPLKASEINKKFNTDITAYEVSRYLSGVIFMEDNCVTSQNPQQSNISSYFYLNPLAFNALSKDQITSLISNTAIDLSI